MTCSSVRCAEYARDWAFKHPYPADFFHTFSRVAGRDLGWYFRTWCYETWTLDQAVESVEPDGNGTAVVIADRGLAPHPTEIEVTYANGSKTTERIDVRHWLSGKRRKKLRLGADVSKVVIDPAQVTLDVSRRNNTWEAGRGGERR